eukprot:SAG31_NODE_13_length_37961_cov_21.751307_17_plen_184_part_00
MQHELELAVVVGKHCKDVSEESALEVVAGYAISLDLTARDIQVKAKNEGTPWLVSKGYVRQPPVTAATNLRNFVQQCATSLTRCTPTQDTFLPHGEFIPASAIPDPHALKLWLKINNIDRQSGATSDMIHSVPKLIAYISSIMTLEPGDVICTGTPEGVAALQPGDQVECGVQGFPSAKFTVV